MIVHLVAALTMAGASAPAPEHGFGSYGPLEPRIEAMVESAWQEQAQNVAQNPPKKDPPLTKAQRDEKRHQEELKADVELGKKVVVQADKELKASTDQAMIDRVNRIGNEFAQISNSTLVKVLWGDKRLNTYNYTFKVVQNKEVNAFSLPGGFIYVYDGLLNYVESDDELAGVMAHEIAHASLRHLATLQREQSKLDLITLPLIIVSLITGGEAGSAGVMLGTLTNTAKGSGWSQQAETSADYAGLQYMLLSKYNPVGMLTFMEKLAKDQSAEFIDWGIYRTHPPSKERALAIEKRLTEASVPIKRSAVAASFRASVKEVDKDTVQILFNKRPLLTLGGSNASARAETLVPRLNEFFDEVPQLFEVKSTKEGAILFRQRELFRIEARDAQAAGVTLDVATGNAVQSIKRELYTLARRIWDAR